MMWNGQRKKNVSEQIIPNPDPSSLTAEKIRHDIAALESTMQSRLDGIQGTLEARLSAMDKASELFDANLNRIPTNVDRQVGQLRELHDARFESVAKLMVENNELRDEKFTSIQQQITERDVRYSLVSSDAKSAVADALAAQKESVYKQDTATQKAIDQQSVLLTGLSNGLGLQIADLKERVSRAESANANAANAVAGRTTSISQVVSYVIAAAAVAAIILDHLPATVK